MKVLALCLTTTRDLLHQKVLYNVVLFGVGLVLASVALVHLTVGQWERLITDMGVSSIGVATSLIAIFMGAGLISTEVERKTLYFVLSKPVGRWQFVLGKFGGLMAVLILNALAMFALVSALLVANSYAPTVALAASVAGSLLEAAILGAVAIAFSGLTTSTVAALATLAVFVAGHILSQVDFFTRGVGPGLRAVGLLMVRLLPDFTLLNFKAQAVDRLPVSSSAVGAAFAYAVGYSVFALTVGVVLFSRRDLK